MVGGLPAHLGATNARGTLATRQTSMPASSRLSFATVLSRRHGKRDLAPEGQLAGHVAGRRRKPTPSLNSDREGVAMFQALQLKISAVALRRVAQLTNDIIDSKAADLAEQALKEHEVAQTSAEASSAASGTT